MKFTLAMLLIVFASGGVGAARGQQSSQPPPQAEATQPSAAEAVPQQQTTPPSTPQPCAAGKDTCTVSEPAKQGPASTPARKTQDQQSGKVAATITKSRAKARRRNAVREQALAHDEPTTKKTIVRQGSTSDPTVLTLGATTETSYSRQTTEDLLAATDVNLKQARSRLLNRNQVETLNQIKLFVEQANTAMKEGDLDRGHNLALKANLLSDDLVKH